MNLHENVKDADRIEDLAGALANFNTDKETIEWLAYILEPEQANYLYFRLGIEAKKNEKYEHSE